MRLHWSVIVTAALCLASCSKEDAGSRAQFPVCFEATTLDLESKAANEIANIGQLRTAHFGIFASYTGHVPYEQTSVVPDFMYNQEISWSSGHWEYTPLKYWPNDGGYVSFFAYAPYEGAPGANKCISGFSPAFEQGDPWLTYRLAADLANQVDLMYGVNSATDSPWLDQQKPAVLGTMLTFQFRHALACIGDRITIKGTDALLTRLSGVGEISINSVTVTFSNLTAKGRLILNSQGAANWKPIVSGDYTTTRSIVANTGSLLLTNTAQTISSNAGLFYIPLNIEGQPAQNAQITVNYTLHLTSSGTDKTGVSQSAPFVLTGDPGSKEGLAITITEDLEVISEVVSANPLTGILPDPQAGEGAFTPYTP